MEWDTAAADAIVREVGLRVFREEPGAENQGSGVLLYNKENLLNPFFLVC